MSSLRIFVYFGVWVCSASLSLAEIVGIDLPIDRTPINREDPAYLTSYAPILKPAKEAVVAVHSASILRVIRQRGMDPRTEMLRRYFGLPTPQREEPEVEERRFAEGVGSGVVISPDGYILTNSHVITSKDGDAADEILVQLNDGREISATLVGRDPRSDLAVLKVEANGLPYLPVADSDLLEVGDIVFAIGNPMGVGLTITQGIVSATGRDNLEILGEAGLESFIQTDAPINPGNSGGALVDAYGRLIGINTAILSRSGGSIGLGFAIPSTFAREIALALARDGVVRRGVLGLSLEDMNAEYSEAFGVPEGGGVLIQSVIEGLPADKAGLIRGDVIRAVDGVLVESVSQLRIRLATTPPGGSIEVRFWRDGALQQTQVVLADPDNPFGLEVASDTILDGIPVAVLDSAQRQVFGIDRRVEGLVVVEEVANSAYGEVLRRGAVLVEINGVRPESVEQARSLLADRKVSRVYIYYKGRANYYALRP